MKMKTITGFLFMAIILTACVTGPVVIPEDITTAELIQKAQEAADRNKYSVSLQYYETIIERFPYEVESVIAAEYEIGFIHYKQKKYDIAKIELTDLLERYNIPDEELLPPQFKILSKIVLGKIEKQDKLRLKDEPAS